MWRPCRPTTRGLAAARLASGREDIAWLASDENPDGCSPRVLEALAGYDPSRYADPACTVLRRALSAFLDEVPDRIVCGNGSEEMIAAFSRAAPQPGREVLTAAPSFGLHEIEPLAAGARVRKIAMRPDFGFDLDALTAALARGPALVFLSSPGNPVGPALDEATLTRLAEAAQARGTLFGLDEAYFQYGGDALPDARRILLRCRPALRDPAHLFQGLWAGGPARRLCHRLRRRSTSTARRRSQRWPRWRTRTGCAPPSGAWKRAARRWRKGWKRRPFAPPRPVPDPLPVRGLRR